MAEPKAVDSENGNGSGKMSELSERRWSVISFVRVEANGISYADASLKMNELESAGVPGLCIVSDEAAARVK